MKARMFFQISGMRFNPPNGLAEVNDNLLFFTDNDNKRNDFYSRNIFTEYGISVKRFSPKTVFGYSEFEMSSSGIVTPEQFQEEYMQAFHYRATYVEALITFLWFVRDNSVGLLSTFGEIPDYKMVNGKSRSIVNYNCAGDLGDTEFTPDEIIWTAKLTTIYSSITAWKYDKIDNTRMLYEYDDNGKPIRFIIPKVPDSFNYNEQTNIDRAINFLIIARNQNYLLYKIAYYMPILECLFSSKSAEITYRMANRVAHYLGGTEADKKHVFDYVNDGYNIRSRFIHGQEVAPVILEKDNLIKLATEIDGIVRRVLIKVITEDSEIFTKYNSTERDLYLDNLVFGLPFDHATTKENIKKREEDRKKTIQRHLDKKLKGESMKSKK